MKRLALLLGLLLPVLAPAAQPDWVRIPGGRFQSALKYPDAKQVTVAPFALMRTPVTNGQYLDFVRAHPEWRRGQAPAVFADARYLARWAGPLATGPRALPNQPVVEVSWFAADAYCKAQGARMPTWSEWEYVAAADELRRDARNDPAWRERILGWYSRPSNRALLRVGAQAPNAYGVQDMHGLIWEWTGDYSALLVDGDNRRQGDNGRGQFCGGGALSARDRENYAVLMRVAMLSSLQGNDTTANLGFRCAR